MLVRIEKNSLTGSNKKLDHPLIRAIILLEGETVINSVPSHDIRPRDL